MHTVDVRTKEQILVKAQNKLERIKKKEQLKECIMIG
jgi:hypothetical protein